MALTSAGKCLALDAEGPWIWVLGGPTTDAQDPELPSIADRFAARLAMLPAAECADCIGFGRHPGFPPIVMALIIKEGVAAAEALFEETPSEEHYELLAAVGVRYLGGEQSGSYWRACFTNTLGNHLLAGMLAGFGRTAHCNLFFLRHGQIDESLEAGLLHAAAARVQHGLNMTVGTAVNLILAARKAELAMTCVPPAPQPSYPFGDLVPLGILAYSLQSMEQLSPQIGAAVALAGRHLEEHRIEDLWPFHHGRLPTATDSALILLGQENAHRIDALERFADGSGGYVPQHSNATGDALHMREDESQRHWRQTDFGTTCLIRSLRRSAGLDQRTSTAWIESWFDHRAALFFANPYIVDWALALAIADDDNAREMRDQLTADILSSVNDDGSFGRFDLSLSTAAAITALSILGHRSRGVRTAQLHLLDTLETQGRGPVTTPFYSSKHLHESATASAIRGRGILSAGGQWHMLSLYEDTHRMILTAFSTLALQAPCDAHERAAGPKRSPHPRYLATTAARYIEAFALPPYLERQR